MCVFICVYVCPRETDREKERLMLIVKESVSGTLLSGLPVGSCFYFCPLCSITADSKASLAEMIISTCHFSSLSYLNVSCAGFKFVGICKVGQDLSGDQLHTPGMHIYYAMHYNFSVLRLVYLVDGYVEAKSVLQSCCTPFWDFKGHRLEGTRVSNRWAVRLYLTVSLTRTKQWHYTRYKVYSRTFYTWVKQDWKHKSVKIPRLQQCSQ